MLVPSAHKEHSVTYGVQP